MSTKENKEDRENYYEPAPRHRHEDEKPSERKKSNKDDHKHAPKE